MSAIILAIDLGRFNRRPVLVDTAVSGVVTAGELVLVMSDGTRETWTRAPAD